MNRDKLSPQERGIGDNSYSFVLLIVFLFFSLDEKNQKIIPIAIGSIKKAKSFFAGAAEKYATCLFAESMWM